MQKKKSGVKKCLEILPLRGGRGGVGPLMANAILNFHFDFLTPSLIIIFCWIVCVESATGTKVQGIPGKRAFREIYSRKNRITAATTTMQNCIKSNFHFQSVFGRGCFCEQMTFREMKSWVLFQFVSRFEIFQPNSRQPL